MNGYKYEREELKNESGNGYGILYKIHCTEEQFSDATQWIIENIIGEEEYYSPLRDVWSQIKIERMQS